MNTHPRRRKVNPSRWPIQLSFSAALLLLFVSFTIVLLFIKIVIHPDTLSLPRRILDFWFEIILISSSIVLVLSAFSSSQMLHLKFEELKELVTTQAETHDSKQKEIKDFFESTIKSTHATSNASQFLDLQTVIDSKFKAVDEIFKNIKEDSSDRANEVDARFNNIITALEDLRSRVKCSQDNGNHAGVEEKSSDDPEKSEHDRDDLASEIASWYNDIVVSDRKSDLKKFTQLMVVTSSLNKLAGGSTSPVQLEEVQSGGSFLLYKEADTSWLIPTFTAMEDFKNARGSDLGMGVFEFPQVHGRDTELNRPAKLLEAGPSLWEVVEKGVIFISG
jgi:hypothetical protein